MEIPLFPLNTVLFPHATLPLHIFEDRYKQMIGQCLEEHAPFGVLLIRSGGEVGGSAEPFEVGTTALISRVQHLDDGNMNLICQGGQRFRTTKTIESQPFLLAEVEVLTTSESTDEKTTDLAGDAGSLFAEYVRLYLAMSNQWARSIEMPSEPDTLADFIGSRLGVSLPTKQRLLEELSARKRLALEVQLLGDAIRQMTSGVQEARTARWHGFSVTN